jgi:UDP-N-acetylglucosamine 2-epimerase (non-hydrolysing)
MKVKPVMDALEERGVEVILVHTGQHYDPAMSDVFFADLGIRRPDHFLGAGSGTHAVQTCRVMTAFEPLAAELAPDVVVVVGDVNSTLACALVTAKLGAPLAHVEAGLRSRDRSMPEEINRLVTDRISDYLFAPSADAVANLRAEGFSDEQVYLVGNVMVDTLLANAGRAAARGTLAGLGLRPQQYGLVTLHRPANVDDPAVLGALLPALAEISYSCPLVLPAHPRVAGRLDGAGLPDGVRIIPPAGYLDFIALEASARLVLTDSGGVSCTRLRCSGSGSTWASACVPRHGSGGRQEQLGLRERNTPQLHLRGEVCGSCIELCQCPEVFRKICVLMVRQRQEFTLTLSAFVTG